MLSGAVDESIDISVDGGIGTSPPLLHSVGLMTSSGVGSETSSPAAAVVVGAAAATAVWNFSLASLILAV